jgi:hypothetical protein
LRAKRHPLTVKPPRRPRSRRGESRALSVGAPQKLRRRCGPYCQIDHGDCSPAVIAGGPLDELRAQGDQACLGVANDFHGKLRSLGLFLELGLQRIDDEQGKNPADEIRDHVSFLISLRGAARSHRLLLVPRPDKAPGHAGSDDDKGDTERKCGGEFLESEEIGNEDFRADEDQDDGKRGLQIAEAMDHCREREIEGAKSEDRKDVRSVDDERIRGDRENRWHRIHGEDDVGNLDHHQRHEKRRDEPGQLTRSRMQLLDEESLAMVFLGDIETVAHEADEHILRDVRFGFLEEQHLDAGNDKERGEDIEDPGEFGDQCRADTDHDRTQHDDAEDAPEEHPVLVDARHGKEREDQGDDEDIVERQRFFDDEAGQVGKAGIGAEMPPHPAAKGQAERDIERGKLDAFAHADFLVLLMENAEIERQDGNDQDEETRPHPQRSSHPLDE